MDKVKDVNSESSTEIPAEIVPQDVKPEEKVEVPEETPSKPATQGVPYERFREVNEKAKALEEELRTIKESSILSEKLAEEYPDWDLMTETEKALTKKVESQEKKLAKILEENAWERDFSQAKEKYPQLGSREKEFKEFCYKYPKGIEAETLAKSFLFDEVSTKQEPEQEKRKGLEKPTGGSRQIPAPGMTLDEIKRLRETQPKLYEKMIREGKLPKKIPEK